MTQWRWLATAAMLSASAVGLSPVGATAWASDATRVGSAGTAAAGDVTIAFDRAQLNLVVGDKFGLTTTIANRGASPTPPFVAHLNVASLTSDVYVDPEDWSPSRSKRVAPLAPGESTTVDWDLQAVNSGWFDVYVVLLPDGSTTLGSGPLTVSPPVLATIGGRQTANPGGALPVVIGVPIALGLGTLGIRYRRRRRSSQPESG